MSEFLLMQLDYAKVASILMGSRTNTDWRCPNDVSNDALSDLTLVILNVLRESAECVDVAAKSVEPSHLVVEVGLRLWQVNSVLHGGCEGLDFPLSSLNTVSERHYMLLD